MRERLSSMLRCFTAAIAVAALSGLLIALMLALYDIERTYILPAGIWAAALLVQAVVNEILVQRSPSMLVYVLVNAALLLSARHHVSFCCFWNAISIKSDTKNLTKMINLSEL